MRALLLGMTLLGCSASTSTPTGADGGPPPADTGLEAGALALADVSCVESIAFENGAPLCVVLKNHQVWCHGGNFDGVLGQGSADKWLSTGKQFVRVGSLDATRLEIGSSNRVCALRADASLWCWGANPSGYVGLDTSPLLAPTQATAFPPPMAQIDFGGFTNCALAANGQVWCWANSKKPALVAGMPADVIEIAAGAQADYARTRDGTLYAWGGGSYGDLGLGETEKETLTPVKNDLLGPVSTVVAGGNHACAIKPDGTVWCWGWSRFGEAGAGGSIPSQMAGLKKPMKSLALSPGHSCSVSTDGELYCWGDTSGSIFGGSSVTKDGATPATAPGGPVASANVGDGLACVVRTDGAVRCWGSSNPFGAGSAAVDVAGPCK